jgi:hypothetical protein
VIDESEGILELFQQMPSLLCLYLLGNPLCKRMQNYRKKMVSGRAMFIDMAAIYQSCMLIR